MENSADCGIRGYRGLKVFQKAQELAGEVIRVTENYPKNEFYGAVAQSRNAALSIPSNIAEGYRRCSRKDFIRFLKIAYGSCGELDAQLSVAFKAGWIAPGEYEKIGMLIDIVSRWTWRLMESLGRSQR